MKKILFMILLLLASAIAVFAQETTVHEKYGFSMQAPKGWIETSTAQLAANLKNFEFKAESLAALVKERNGNALLVAYIKYDPQTTPGLIPTIRVNANAMTAVGFLDFKSQITKNIQALKQHFEDYEFIEEPKEIEISGIRSVVLVGKFTLKTQDGQLLKVRNRVYAIPMGNYFLQLTFTDGQVGEDCTAEFLELVKTVRIDRATAKKP